MKYRKLGRTDLVVSEIGLGTWAIGGDEWGPTDEAESIRTIQRALELGVNFIDTADVYGAGHSEELIATALKARRDEYIVASKVGFDIYSRPGIPGGSGQNFSRDYIVFAADQSLMRLQTDVIDLYQLHNPSLQVIQQGEALETLEKLKAQGKIRFIGVSIDTVEEGIACIETGKVDTLMVTYNLLVQEPAKVLFPLARSENIGIIIRTPLAFGLLTDKYTPETIFPEGDFRREKGKGWLLEELRKVEKLRFLVKGRFKTLTQAAIAFVLSNDAVSGVIPGAKTVRQVEENSVVSSLAPLDPEDLQRVIELYKRNFT